MKKITVLFMILCLIGFYSCNQTEKAWEKAKQSKSISEIQKFLSEHPGSKFDNDAKLLIESLTVKVKIELPLELNARLEIPEGARMTLSDGPMEYNRGNSDFDPPVHPKGTIETLSLHGKVIPLKTRDINDGIISTKDFGEIEVILLGIRNGGGLLEFKAFPSDIEKLNKF